MSSKDAKGCAKLLRTKWRVQLTLRRGRESQKCYYSESLEQENHAVEIRV